MNNLHNNPYLRRPNHPNYNRRARHHDYHRPAKYLITSLKNPSIPPFAIIVGDPYQSEGENTPQPVITKTGEFIIEAMKIWQEKYPQIEISEFVIMPDHIHLCLNVTKPLPNGLSLAISSLKGQISSLRHKALPDRFRLDKVTPVFEKGFNDRIAYTAPQWERQKNYTKDNPRRYLIKKLFPDYMYRLWKIRMGEYEFMAKGNIMLLKEPSLFVVKHHRKWTEQESSSYQTESKIKIENGEIPVSPFIHPKEKALRDYAIEDGGCYIRICENGFADRQSASGFEFDMMAAGRLLLIGPIHHATQKRDMKYAYAQKLNAFAAKLVELHQNGINGIIST